MFRKKVSPVLVVSLLLSMTLIVFLGSMYIQNNNYKRLHGMAVKNDIFAINDLTNGISNALDSEDLSELVYLVGQLERCVVGGEINEDYDGLRAQTAAAVYDYALAPRDGETVSSAALELLRADARDKNALLHATTQYIMGELNDTDTDDMHLKYFNTLSGTSKQHQLISAFISRGIVDGE